MTKADSVRICIYVISSLLLRHQEIGEIYYNIHCNLNLLGYLVIEYTPGLRCQARRNVSSHCVDNKASICRSIRILI